MEGGFGPPFYVIGTNGYTARPEEFTLTPA